jgi:hypothetical protein
MIREESGSISRVDVGHRHCVSAVRGDGLSKGACPPQHPANLEQSAAWLNLVKEDEPQAIVTAAALPSFAHRELPADEGGRHNVLITNPRDIPGFAELQKTSSPCSPENTLFNAS